MRKTKKILYVLLALCLLLTGSLSAYGTSIGDAVLTEAKPVLSEKLSAALEKANEDELLPVDVWVEEVDIDQVEADVLRETGLNKEKIAELDATGEELTIEQIDEYIAAERRIYSERQRALSEQIVQNTLGKAKAAKVYAQREIYISSYAPRGAHGTN